MQWQVGTAAGLPTAAFALAQLTSHVAQVISDEAEWLATLHHLHRAVVPGGRLAFDSRDPAARAWEQWPPRPLLHRSNSPMVPTPKFG